MSDLLILCYHAVSERWPTEFAVSPRSLDAQLHYFLRRGYRPATLSAALRRPPGQKTLVVTFDDAFASVVEQALPVLSARGVPATVFVPTSYVAGEGAMEWASMGDWVGTAHEDELRCMSWEDLRGLAAAGWEIGSHTSTHPKLISLGDLDLDRELSASKARCEEEVQQPCEALAYPFGAHDRRVMDRTRAAGYSAAVILDNHLAIPAGSLVRPQRPREMFGLLREGVYRRDGWPRLVAKTSLLARRARASRFARVALPAA
ncbi:MAG TPA: polysaccharide deacetylase family protein [Solirubrobacterales bacterium]|nr:polysaccharide deacetylase family protein [Solirubrobacterales bacterium]